MESDTTVQYQSYHIFLGFQFLVYEKVERIFLIISDYLKQKADACRRNVSQIRLEVSYHRLAGWRLATNRMPSRDGARPLANQSARGGSRVDAASKKKYAFACFLFVATSHAILPCRYLPHEPHLGRVICAAGGRLFC